MFVHEVCVDDFYIGKYEVKQGEWKKIMGSNPARFKSGDNYPVESISWNDIQEFIIRLNRKTGKNYRLPTEAEWEYAARSGGRNQKWSGTNNESDLGIYAWHQWNSDNSTQPVGKKRPNAFGLFDMTGNVWEWVQDWYNKGYYLNSPKNNPKGPLSGSYRGTRGGCWGGHPRSMRASNRGRASQEHGDSITGFRIAMTP